MGQVITQISVKGLHFLVGILIASAAVGAPNSDSIPPQDCLSKAALQRTLDYAKCGALPFERRTPCIIQVEQNYAAAVAACATAGTSQKGVTIKQNVDAPFTRRLRN